MGQEDARLRPQAVDGPPIRDAASVIVLRDTGGVPSVLMGQRGSSAAFMPDKFVFPGGAVDAEDASVPLACPLSHLCETRLSRHADPDVAPALVAAAIRELWEETGLVLGQPGVWPGPAPRGWRGFADAGFRPSAAGVHFVFRAITPPGRPRRFDARFFLVEAGSLASDPDDFSGAEDELRHLQWVPLSKARSFNLPFITEVVLAEVMAMVRNGMPPASVPFFNNLGERSEFLRIGA
ncbi:NTP pyrophosphohydrolases including oxidative damage repair enzyme [Rhodovulum sp. P5]|uniref:NUDIX hydrolase n=1 Tax=Rhodovulum sp. P5 TaxID=1564506 RepID=UPI0009C1EDA5|nr:NUDIX hydrolase [Rhodovulum sp. P5]ARE39625.1 NTP pyrophosphohydrolases including oxidative damage repair enzyme [Rhodovulum sp. P5]